MKTDKYLGLDVHKDTTVIAIAEGGRDGESRLYGTISSDLHALEKVLRKLGGEGVTLHVVYEAGPTGYVVYRRLLQLGIDCIVVAPSRTPQPKGVRQKTDRRDAMMLARLHRAGELTGIHIPDAIDESIRDLTRTRADAVHDLTRAKQRLKSFLLRQGYKYAGKANWSDAHQRYLRELVLPLPALKSVLEEYLLAIEQRFAAVERLDDLIAAQVPAWRMYPAVQALMGLRGFQLYAAAVVVCELGDIHRFRHPRHLMAFLGLIPREHTSADNRKLGAITKTGNSHARWILGEVVQHAFLPPKVSSHLALRQQGLPTAYRELSWKMQTRLHQRSRHLIGRGIIKPKVTIALARELCGFIWALLRQVKITA